MTKTDKNILRMSLKNRSILLENTSMPNIIIILVYFWFEHVFVAFHGIQMMRGQPQLYR